jgi:DNA-directed RNA polymerase subunit beta
MAQSFTGKKRIRKSFGRIPEAVQMPNLIEVQRSSYEQFLQREVRPGVRKDEGIEAVFKSVFPIKDFNERAVLEYVSYEFEEPKYDVEECIQRDMTFAAPLKVKLRLIVFETEEETGARSVKDIKEQDVYMGDIPLMTDKGTFIVNGTERVIVSQMHRSPGVFFDHDKGKTHASGKLLFAARVIPYRGSWLDFEFDAKDVVYVRIDRRRKLPATTFLYALGMDGEEILTTFYDVVPFEKREGGWATPYKPERWRGVKPEFALSTPTPARKSLRPAPRSPPAKPRSWPTAV